jgi:hypothetical protein
MTRTMERRVRQIRSRALIRSRQYRQSAHASGVWFRLRRLLAEARSAWLITDEEACRLIARGLPPEPVGDQLEPPKRILFVPEALLADLPGRQEIPVRVTTKLLTATNIALVRFE